jgi:hypothetical protein
MALSTRNTKWFVVKEVTEGTPVSPSAGNQAVSIQDGAFSLEGSFESLTNSEIKGSIGQAKAVQGLEAPTASYSHYLNHSSVEGQKPEYDLFCESIFGSVSVRSTERSTIAASTAGSATVPAVLKVGGGFGAEFSRGDVVMIKDATNGYSIRCVKSVATDDLTINFNLAAAPASGVALGKGVTFKPTNSGHPSLSIWDYRGEGAPQLGAGMQVTSMSLEATANEFINASFELEGTKIYFHPLEVTASNYKLDFTDSSSTFQALITQKVYRSPIELAAEIQSKIDALSADTITVTYSSTTGKFTFLSTGTTLSLLWNTGAGTAATIGALIGFSTAADDTGSLTYTSDNAISVVAPYTPSLDGSNPIVAKSQQLIIGNFTETSCVSEGVQAFSFEMSVEKPKIPSLCADSGVSGSVASARTVSGSATITLPTYEAQKFQDFVSSTTRALQFTFGEKSSDGNWAAGKAGALYCSEVVYTSHVISDADGTVTLELGFSGHVDSSGNGEVYLGFV